MSDLKDSRWAVAILLLVAVSLLFAVSGCGTIMNGSVPADQRGDIDAVALICDLLFWGGLGLVIDILTGGLWERKIAEEPAKP